MRVLTLEQTHEWRAALSRSCRHDFYHTPTYHALAERRDGGVACLFVHEQGPYDIALPLLLRPVRHAPGIGRAGAGWHDATSVYGYVGPVTSHEHVPDDVLRGFRSALRTTLDDLGVVTVFSRLHPLLEQRRLLVGLGDRVPTGTTVSLDLTLPPDRQFALYRTNHRRDVNRLRRMGVACVDDGGWAHLDEFVAVYHETMQRVAAAETYLFDRDYFAALSSASDFDARLFVCRVDGRVLAGGVFVRCGDLVQYHLGGTRDSSLRASPMKLVFDTVRVWAGEAGARVLHLGGGVGGQADSLLHFKAGFSNRTHAFTVWHWVLRPDVYAELCAARLTRSGLDPSRSDQGYFPAYRSPDDPAPRLPGPGTAPPRCAGDRITRARR